MRNCKYCEIVEEPSVPSEEVKELYKSIGKEPPTTVNKYFCIAQSYEKEICNYSNSEECPYYKPQKSTFEKLKCRSELTYKDFPGLFNTYVYLEWNNTILFDDVYGGETKEALKEIEKRIENKKISSIEVKIIDFHHTALKNTGEEL